jgi:hypothetical protein
MGFIAVIAAAIAGFAFGAVWYMTLGKPWAEAAGVKLDDQGRPAEGMSPVPFVISGICMLLVAGMMRHIFAMAGIDGVGKSLLGGLGVGLFFITPWMAMNYAYAMRPGRLTLIDGGYSVIGCGLIGLVLGLF